MIREELTLGVRSVPIKGFLNYHDAEQLVENLRKRIEKDKEGRPTR